ncbi:hypothetical protein E2C01_076823 [Portunus trituberculatus]|uniref:Uncharacterized protein n=1 Tax=Portunus trituberculatus TaxID=210409 RepID=A0A5B7IK22_PORTR|nr:hypothetical protein [Portunus trituberculatus]
MSSAAPHALSPSTSLYFPPPFPHGAKYPLSTTTIYIFSPLHAISPLPVIPPSSPLTTTSQNTLASPTSTTPIHMRLTTTHISFRKVSPSRELFPCTNPSHPPFLFTLTRPHHLQCPRHFHLDARGTQENRQRRVLCRNEFIRWSKQITPYRSALDLQGKDRTVDAFSFSFLLVIIQMLDD